MLSTTRTLNPEKQCMKETLVSTAIGRDAGAEGTPPVAPVSRRNGELFHRATWQDLLKVRACTTRTQLPPSRTGTLVQSTWGCRGHAHGAVHQGVICSGGEFGCLAQVDNRVAKWVTRRHGIYIERWADLRVLRGKRKMGGEECYAKGINKLKEGPFMDP